MFAKKIIIGLVLLATATTLATTGAFANAPGGAYIQCDGACQMYPRQLVIGLLAQSLDARWASKMAG
jgi:hypothetical protein